MKQVGGFLLLVARCSEQIAFHPLLRKAAATLRPSGQEQALPYSNAYPIFRLVIMTIHPMEARHWPQVRAIYEAGIATGHATFATRLPRGQGWSKAHLPHGRLVALHPNGRMLGWAALAPAAEPGYPAGVARIQVYVAPAAQGQGVGRALLTALVAASEAHGIWTLHAVVFPENLAVQRLCQRAGFRVVGQHARIGQLHGIWRDVLVLERRSPVVGTTDASLLPVSRPLRTEALHSARNTMGSVTLTHTG